MARLLDFTDNSKIILWTCRQERKTVVTHEMLGALVIPGSGVLGRGQKNSDTTRIEGGAGVRVPPGLMQENRVCHISGSHCDLSVFVI